MLRRKILVHYRMIPRLVYCVCLFPYFMVSESKVSTACYGIPGLKCTEHKLTCTESLFISITNITFGYRQGCSSVGLSSCPGDTACCREETGDCFTPYNQTLLSQLQQTCSGRSTCTLNIDNGLNERSSYCSNGTFTFHSYSKIEYPCSAKDTESTTVNTSLTSSETAYSVEELGIVGGVLGAVILICIVTIVILVIYINRRLSKMNSESQQNDHQYDTAPSRFRDEPPAIYDSLNTGQQNGYQQQETVNEPTRSSNDTQQSTIDNEDLQTNLNNQDYEHPYLRVIG